MNPVFVKRLRDIGASILDTPPWLLFSLAASIAIWIAVDVAYNNGFEDAKRDYEARITRVNNAHERAAEQQAETSAGIIAELKETLKETKALAAAKQPIIKEVKTYVTKQADAQCVIPAGFVSLHNQTLAESVAELARSNTGDVDAASGVALSEVAEVTAFNNAECVERGKLIDVWQSWYVKERANFEAGRRIIESAVKQK